MILGGRDDAIAWCLRDQDSAAFHARAAISFREEGLLNLARCDQDDAAFYSRLARINLLRLLGTISAYEQDV